MSFKGFIIAVLASLVASVLIYAFALNKGYSKGETIGRLDGFNAAVSTFTDSIQVELIPRLVEAQYGATDPIVYGARMSIAMGYVQLNRMKDADSMLSRVDVDLREARPMTKSGRVVYDSLRAVVDSALAGEARR